MVPLALGLLCAGFLEEISELCAKIAAVAVGTWFICVQELAVLACDVPFANATLV